MNLKDLARRLGIEIGETNTPQEKVCGQTGREFVQLYAKGKLKSGDTFSIRISDTERGGAFIPHEAFLSSVKVDTDPPSSLIYLIFADARPGSGAKGHMALRIKEWGKTGHTTIEAWDQQLQANQIARAQIIRLPVTRRSLT